MNPETLAKRHQQLCEAGIASVRRLAIGGLIFAVLVLIKVIAPYGSKETLQTQLSAIEQETESMERNLLQIEEINQQLTKIIKDVIETNQLEKAKIELQNFFSSGSPGDAQARANDTLEQIKFQINALIVDPLRETTEKQNVDDELAMIPKMVEAEIDKWIDSKIDQKWYISLQGKVEAFKEVQDILKELSDKAVEITSNAKARLETKQKVLSAALEEKKVEQKVEVEKLNQLIDEAMDSALPAWASKLISPPTLVMLYPWLLVAIVVFIAGRAVNAAHHYHGMANVNGWTAEERSDPLMSSIWTLTYRGKLGTIMTQALYGLVLLSLWYCFYLSQQYTQVEFITNLVEKTHNLPTEEQKTSLTWLGHSLMLLAITVALFIPWRPKGIGNLSN